MFFFLSANMSMQTSQGLYCSLRQLLEEGFFHADPHPGNLVATEGGSLAYFDFGMMGDIPRHYRVGLIQMVRSPSLLCVTMFFNCSTFNWSILTKSVDFLLLLMAKSDKFKLR